MPNGTFVRYSNKDALHAIWGLAFRDNFPPNPRKHRSQVATVYMTASSTMVHSLLQMSPNDRRAFAIDFCAYLKRGPHSATALGLESIFFTLASDPSAAKILFDLAPLSEWLGSANTEAANRSAGAAFIDLSHPERGAIFGREKISAMMQGGADYAAMVAHPDAFVTNLFARADAIIKNPGTATVDITDVVNPMNELKSSPDSNPMDQTDEFEAVVGDELEALVGFGLHPGRWSAGTWAKAFTALGLILAAGVIIATGAAPAGLWLLNVALFSVDAALLNFADGVMSSPTMIQTNRPIPDLPEGIVTVEMGTVTGIYIDGAPDATPVQPP